MPLLELRDLAVRYHSGDARAVRALEEVSLDVEEGEVVGLLGESGCGKTTLLLAILGLLPASAAVRGSVRFRGQELLGLRERDLRAVRGAGIAMVFQDPTLALNPVRRVGAQVAEVVAAHRAWSRQRCRAEATSALAEVGFADAEHVGQAFPHELSGGQRQRVLMAQALACGPALVLADEPTAALDAVTQAELRGVLAGLRRSRSLAVLMVSHDLASIAALARRAAVMYAGRLVEVGTAAQVFGAPLHPYSRGLLRALPPGLGSLDRAALVPIAGAPPDLTHLPSGCAFEPRCPDRVSACAERPPRVVVPGPDRLVRCFSYGG